MASFSPSLMLAGMDYLAPSAVCVLPTRLAAPAAGAPGGGVLRHVGGGSGAEVVKIALQDCLACSGCVTTAETILVTAQSRAEVERQVAQEPARPLLVSVSDQAAASLAAHLGTTVAAAFALVSGFAREVLRATFVVDLRWALAVQCHETAAEYVRRATDEPERLPLITSTCPGWVCYCEKQCPALLPHLCPVMSPQGISGAYAKRVVPTLRHFSIQPCFDRKLEAARDGVDHTMEGERCTDCVISTQELLHWMTDVDPSLPWRAALDSALEPVDPPPPPPSDVATTSDGCGGLLRYVMRHAARALHGVADLADESLAYEVRRNANHQIVTSPALPGTRFCLAYGFQHIQNIVRGMKRRSPTGTGQLHFIELMACPDGCLNGGGQIRTTEHAATLEAVKRAHRAWRGGVADPAGEDGVAQLRKVRRVEAAAAGTPAVAFTAEAALALAAQLRRDSGPPLGTPSIWAAVFHDRQKEFEQMLNQGNVHSLKW